LTKYTDEEMKTAIRDMLKDENASAAFRKDFEELVVKHTARWLVMKKFSKNYGTVVTSGGISKLSCPVCNRLNSIDSNYCDQCSNQLQDTGLEKMRKKYQGIKD
jgi:hypothetical protein